MHLLGYWIDPAERGLGRVCERLVRARGQRNPQVVARLADLGCRISMQQVQDLAGGAVIGRPHIARALVAAGCARTVKQAFSRYLAKGAPAYVPRDKLSDAEAIAAIHGAGGIAALAHPAQLGCRTRAELDQLVGRLAGLGIEAIEVHHPDHRPEQTRAYMELAARYGLAMVGGSDFHGPPQRGARRVGFCSLRIPYEWLEPLRARLAARRGRTMVSG
jgi:predicted metal-dependent phosphoesterase TrpH